MILLVDAGNSRIKWASYTGGERGAHGALATADGASLAEVWRELRPDWVGVSNVAGAAVAAAITQALETRAAELFWLQPERQAYGVLNPYLDLGVDRYAALVAVRQRNVGHCVVASLGTALTVDALTAEGEFLGGLIAPGYVLMRQALLVGTAGVRPVAGSYAPFPRNTDDAVETGIITALLGTIEAMRGRTSSALGADVRLILTGGDAARLAPQFTVPVSVIDNLVMEGLLWIAKAKNARGA